MPIGEPAPPHALHAEIAALEAENARLRAALQAVADADIGDMGGDDGLCVECQMMITTAIRALGDTDRPAPSPQRGGLS